MAHLEEASTWNVKFWLF